MSNNPVVPPSLPQGVEELIRELLAALEGLRALILGEDGASAYECVDGERADAAIRKARVSLFGENFIAARVRPGDPCVNEGGNWQPIATAVRPHARVRPLPVIALSDGVVSWAGYWMESSGGWIDAATDEPREATLWLPLPFPPGTQLCPAACPSCGCPRMERIVGLWLCQKCGHEWDDPPVKADVLASRPTPRSE